MLSIIPFDRMSQREREVDRDRPFKAYPRVTQTMPTGSYYGPYTPPTFVGSVGIPASHAKLSVDRGTMDHLRSSSHLDRHPMDAMPNLMDISQARSSTPGHHHHQMKQESYYGAAHHHQMVQPMHGGYGGNIGHSLSPAGTPGHDAASKLPTSTSSPTSSIQEADSNNSSSPNSQHNQSDEGHSMSKIPPKKRPLSVPDQLKDSCYWEKRKKNNDSAKRSRDARRMKEEQIAMRVVYLEQENLQLRTEVSLLKSEIEKLRCMLYNS